MIGGNRAHDHFGAFAARAGPNEKARDWILSFDDSIVQSHPSSKGGRLEKINRGPESEAVRSVVTAMRFFE
jgi:hypothetical protein